MGGKCSLARARVCAAAVLAAGMLAACSSDESAPAEVAVGADTIPPTAPASLQVTATTTSSVTLSWSASTDSGSGLGGYRIFRDQSQNPLANVTGTSHTDAGLSPDTTYQYRVIAYDRAQPANESAAATASARTRVAIAPDTTPPSTPANLRTTAITSTSVSIAWNASTDTGGSGLAGYRVARNGALIGTVTAGTTALADSGLLASTAYAYVVFAFDGAGNTSTASATLNVTTNSTGGGTTISAPLDISTVNPRYFADPSGKAVLLGGSHHWLKFIDSGTVFPPPAFDYGAYLDFLASNHHNFFRLWAQALPKKNYTIQDAGPWYQSPHPWLRTGAGNATDGQPKFDLARFNQAYFDRMRSRVQQAGARGIYVSIMLFDGYHILNDRRSDDGFPLSGANNINGVDDGGGTRSQDLGSIPAAVLAAEEAYVRKVIDTVNDLPNVLYEIANEPGSSSLSWQQHFITFVRSYEAGKPFRHPVGFTSPWGGSADSTLYSSMAEWVSPAEQFPSNDGTRAVILNDTDHSYGWSAMQAGGAAAHRAFVWKNFTAGNSVLFMDPYLMPWTTSGDTRNAPGGCSSGPSCTTLDPRWDAIRKNIGYMLDYANGKLALAKMLPRGSLSSTGHCLANPASAGAEYLVYAPSGGTFTVNLSATTRTLNVEWLNPTTGAISSAGTVTGGSSSHSFTAPFGGDAVLYLVDAAGHGP